MQRFRTLLKPTLDVLYEDRAAGVALVTQVLRTYAQEVLYNNRSRLVYIDRLTRTPLGQRTRCPMHVVVTFARGSTAAKRIRSQRGCLRAIP